MEKPDPVTPSTVLHLSLQVAGSRSLGLLWLDVSAGVALVPAAEGVMEPVWDLRPHCRRAGLAHPLQKSWVSPEAMGSVPGALL